MSNREFHFLLLGMAIGAVGMYSLLWLLMKLT
jgi:hypothetical protein